MKNKTAKTATILVSALLTGVIFALVLASFSFGWEGEKREKITLDGYVYDSCGGCFSNKNPCKPCQVVKELEAYLYGALDQYDLRDSFSLEVHNLLYDEEQTALEERLPGVTLGEEQYPVVFIGDRLLCGWDEIKKDIGSVLRQISGKETATAMPAASEKIELVQAEEPTVVYFMMTSCRSCKEAGAYLDTLREKEDAFTLQTFNMEDSESVAVFQEYCSKYGLNTEETYVPVVFIGDKSLEGTEEIKTFLESFLDLGYADTTYCMK